ncbi:MAG: substrate-binding domain-containing protein [Oscillospiraceae bacterium]|nr:substrate-binding domain-containing protein [Oscillospiraceae bacterium]
MKKRPIIGVIFFNLLQDSYTSLISGISSQAEHLGCDVIYYCLFHTDDKQACEAGADNFYNQIEFDCLDAVIFVDSFFWARSLRSQVTQLLHDKCRKPVLCLDSSENSGFYNIGMRNKEAFETITDHLINVHGCRKIYCLTGQKENRAACERLSGYLSSMEKNNIPVFSDYIYYGGFTERFADMFAKELLESGKELPEAIICANDTLAIRLIKILTDHNIQVPGDIAVTGFDGTDSCCLNVPGVSTYKNMHATLGSDAVVKLYNIITQSNVSCSPETHGEFVPLESCGCGKLDRKSAKEIYENERQDNLSMYIFATGGMLEKLTGAPTFSDALEVTDRYLFMMGHFKKFVLCIHPSFFEPAYETHEIRTGMFESVYAVSFKEGPRVAFPVGTHTTARYRTRDLYNEIISSCDEPGSYFVTPLIFCNRYYGMSIIRYETHAQKPDSLYCLWNMNITGMLDRFFRGPDFPGKDTPPDSHNRQPLPHWLCRLIEQMDDKENFTLGFPKMISLANMSKEHISREFRKYLNMSPTEFINRKRITYAAKLIEGGMNDFCEISEECGFNSVSHFYHLFHKYMNCSPGQYLKSK